MRALRYSDIKTAWLLRALRFWPPYLGAGISVPHVADDLRQVHVQMKLRFFNRNYVGVHFGGSLYGMIDPFYMIMMMHNLGPQYVVWDKAASIRFKRPGKGTVEARFVLTPDAIHRVIEQADSGVKVEPVFGVDITDAHGDVVCHAEKTLYVRRK